MCVLALDLVIGTAVERVYGRVRWLEVYLACGIVGQAFGYLWDPPDAGSSVAGAGLLGALFTTRRFGRDRFRRNHGKEASA